MKIERNAPEAGHPARSKFEQLRQVLPRTAEVNEEGHLVLGGCDSVELAEEFGTPLFVYCEDTVRSQCHRYAQACETTTSNTEIIYAGKAFISVAMCQLIEEEGLSLDISSGGELHTALKAGFPPEKMYFHGNNKSRDELESAVKVGVGRIVVDNLDELRILDEIGRASGKRIPILLRLTPGIEAETHRFLQTATLDSKFGFTLAQDIALEAVRTASGLANIELRGLHAHIGSQLLSLAPYDDAAKVMVDFAGKVAEETTSRAAGGGVIQSPLELNLGGGLGIRYTPTEEPPSIQELADVVVHGLRKKAQDLGLGELKIMLEPGRSIVGRAGVTLYRVGAIKDVPEQSSYVSVDGGMSDNMRPLLYDAKYEALVANKAAQEGAARRSIAGKHCETGDVLIRDCELPPIELGDTICVGATGAYGYSMANNYNKVPRPAVVLVSGGRSRLIVKRETYDDLVRLDLPLA